MKQTQNTMHDVSLDDGSGVSFVKFETFCRTRPGQGSSSSQSLVNHFQLLRRLTHKHDTHHYDQQPQLVKQGNEPMRRNVSVNHVHIDAMQHHLISALNRVAML